jgi:hypothetical protein
MGMDMYRLAPHMGGVGHVFRNFLLLMMLALYS